MSLKKSSLKKSNFYEYKGHFLPTMSVIFPAMFGGGWPSISDLSLYLLNAMKMFSWQNKYTEGNKTSLKNYYTF